VLYFLLTIGLAFGWAFYFCDVTTAFLHAWLSEGTKIYVWPPKEFYAAGDILWRLRRAMYGLRTSPAEWQKHFADTMAELKFVRLQSDANVYVNYEELVFILAYVDDLMVMGPDEAAEEIITKLKEKFLLKQTGTLSNEGDTIQFLGRQLTRRGDAIVLTMNKDYLNTDFELLNIMRCQVRTSARTCWTVTNPLRRKIIADTVPPSEDYNGWYPYDRT